MPLDNESKNDENLNLKAFITRTSLFIALPFFLGVVAYYYTKSEWSLWFGVSIAILLSAYLQNLYFQKENKNLKKEFIDERDKVEEIIRELLSPGILSYDDIDKVREVAAKILMKPCYEEEEDRKFVVYLGGPSLVTKSGKEQEEVEYEIEEKSKTSSQAYSRALKTLETKRVRVKRYIDLPKAEEIINRNPNLRKKYQIWLKEQIDRLMLNPAYEIIDSKRAPIYGASQTAIITYSSILFIQGPGESAILINGEDISEKTLLKMENYILSKFAINEPVYYQKQNIKDFKKFIKELRIELIELDKRKSEKKLS